jgi:hypothetical protein
VIASLTVVRRAEDAGEGDSPSSSAVLKVKSFPNKSFFLYVVPHGAAPPPRRFADLFLNAAAPPTPSFSEADVSDKPAQIRNKPKLTAAQIW